MQKRVIYFSILALTVLSLGACKSSKKCGCPTFGQINTGTELSACAPHHQKAI